LCFDLRSGKKRWERQFWATGNTGCHPKTNMAASTPATDGERVYALFATADLACLDKDGDLVWYRSLVGDYPTLSNQLGMAASPAAAKNLVLAPGGETFALHPGSDKSEAKPLWKTNKLRTNYGTPLYHQGRIYNVNTANVLVCVDAADGKVLWQERLRGTITA